MEQSFRITSATNGWILYVDSEESNDFGDYKTELFVYTDKAELIEKIQSITVAL